MDLALRGAGADRGPAHQVADVLRRDRVEILGAGAETDADDVTEQATGGTQAEIDVERVVELRVVDQPLPAHGRPGLLKVNPHDDEDVFGDRVGLFLETRSVFTGGIRVVDGTRADDGQEPPVATCDDVAGLTPDIEYQGRLILLERVLLDDLIRCHHFGHAGDTDIVGQVLHARLVP